MILHLMPNEKFIAPFIEFINKNFDNEEHFFFIMSGLKDKPIPNYKNIYYYEYKESNFFLRKFEIILGYLKLFPYLFKSEKIILHSLFSSITNLFLLLNFWCLKKSYWGIWGGDLYPHIENKSNLSYKLKNIIARKLKGIISLAPEDKDIFLKVFNLDTVNSLYGMYINPVSKENLEINYIKDDNCINIQIGNSSTLSNYHEEVIKLLEKFKNENIKIFVPLSYGDKEYGKKIKNIGIETFGDKFIAMEEFLSPQEYAVFLNKIDIAIFNHNRQQGLGNFYSLGYLGKKIYSRRDNSTWNYLNEFIGMKLFDIKNIENETFQEFCTISRRDKESIISASQKFYDENFISQLWKEIFNQ